MSVDLDAHLRDKHNQKDHGRRGRFNTAATGKTALKLATVTGELTPAQTAAIDRYGGEAYQSINENLRLGYGSDQVQSRHQSTVEGLDEVMAQAALPVDVVVHRRVTGEKVFGDAYAGDLTGMVWLDPAFVSTSVEERGATGADRMRIFVPAGTPGFSSGLLDPDEILLGRGLRFRVVKDHRADEVERYGTGIRRVLDVEVVNE